MVDEIGSNLLDGGRKVEFIIWSQPLVVRFHLCLLLSFARRCRSGPQRAVLEKIRFCRWGGDPTGGGFGGFVGYLLLAALLYAGNLLGVTVFWPGYLTALAAVLTLSLLAVLRFAPGRPRFRMGYSLIPTLPIILIVGISLYHVAMAPISSWDSLPCGSAMPTNTFSSMNHVHQVKPLKATIQDTH